MSSKTVYNDCGEEIKITVDKRAVRIAHSDMPGDVFSLSALSGADIAKVQILVIKAVFGEGMIINVGEIKLISKTIFPMLS